jgi:hypothetical protein
VDQGSRKSSNYVIKIKIIEKLKTCLFSLAEFICTSGKLLEEAD